MIENEVVLIQTDVSDWHPKLFTISLAGFTKHIARQYVSYLNNYC